MYHFFSEGFPYYYDTIKWQYENAKWPDPYKYLVLYSYFDTSVYLQEPPINISVSVIFGSETFYSIGLNQVFTLQMIAGFIVRVSATEMEEGFFFFFET